ncbi:MAG: hypothetical protein AAFR99_01775, partial [Cyanobacteria bacterium J06629_9]
APEAIDSGVKMSIFGAFCPLIGQYSVKLSRGDYHQDRTNTIGVCTEDRRVFMKRHACSLFSVIDVAIAFKPVSRLGATLVSSDMRNPRTDVF